MFRYIFYKIRNSKTKKFVKPVSMTCEEVQKVLAGKDIRVYFVNQIPRFQQSQVLGKKNKNVIWYRRGTYEITVASIKIGKQTLRKDHFMKIIKEAIPSVRFVYALDVTDDDERFDKDDVYHQQLGARLGGLVQIAFRLN